ncbi:hypothetical protein NDU88_006158 [Pleurodeles waltl]|uniref:Uncharacterized protein n=1 Tax=Pleurodeles waltl TaxID=8319 RepID=A0AAV7WDW1_PLEWA|nr:hypothetical protein NDU88_006158 [Pleurodeles waltl]
MQHDYAERFTGRIYRKLESSSSRQELQQGAVHASDRSAPLPGVPGVGVGVLGGEGKLPLTSLHLCPLPAGLASSPRAQVPEHGGVCSFTEQGKLRLFTTHLPVTTPHRVALHVAQYLCN